MKQVININFRGRVVPIETGAYDILKNYIDSLSRHFANTEGKEEIINDIESRIGELFEERIKSGATCITDDDVNAIIANMGRPEDFDTEGDTMSAQQTTSAQQPQGEPIDPARRRRLYRSEDHKILGGVCGGLADYFNIDVVVVRIIFLILVFSFGFGVIPYIILWIAVPSASSKQLGSYRKKLYRDPEDKYAGGVCSGIGHYFGISPWIPRVLFILPFLSVLGSWGNWGWYGDFPNFLRLTFSPGSLFIYVILWMVLPEANTTAEKLEMKGEKVDMNSIKNSVVEEMKGVQKRAQGFATTLNERGKEAGADIREVSRRGSRSAGDIIAFIFKLFGYFILGCICFGLVIALFAISIAAIGIFPFKGFILEDGLQDWLAWGTLIFFIIVPVLGAITWLIRRLARTKKHSKWLRIGFPAAWAIGWICVFWLGSLVGRNFSSNSSLNEQQVVLGNASIDSLEVTNLMPGQRYTKNRWFEFEPWSDAEDDTMFVRNVEIQIVKSQDSVFHVTTTRLATGRSRRTADEFASRIPFNIMQQNGLLIIDKAIPVTRTDKFRNQRVILTFYVPEGKRIFINRNIGWSHNVRFDGPWTRDWEGFSFENLENGWEQNEWLTMTKDGLKDEQGRYTDYEKRERGSRNFRRDDWSDDRRDNAGDEGGRYRYDQDAIKPAPFDSLKKELDRKEREYLDSLKKEKQKLDERIEAAETNATATAFSVNPIERDPQIFLN